MNESKINILFMNISYESYEYLFHMNTNIWMSSWKQHCGDCSKTVACLKLLANQSEALNIFNIFNMLKHSHEINLSSPLEFSYQNSMRKKQGMFSKKKKKENSQSLQKHAREQNKTQFC